MTVTYRDLESLADFRRVLALEREVWAMTDDELVPPSLFVVSVKCGAILVGAFEGERLVGFVYSFPGDRHGRRLQWSHMLGVAASHRGTGVGHVLKLRQRERALAQGLDLVEWTYDPLQAANAHFNFKKLGVVVKEYVEDAYGESHSPLHRGAPTDRFVAQWWLRSEVVRTLAEPQDSRAGSVAASGRPDTRSPSDEARAPADRAASVNPLRRDGPWWVCDEAVTLPPAAPSFRVSIPPRFTAMLTEAPEVASRWRTTTRRLFRLALAEGYAAVGFERDVAGEGGDYVFARDRRATATG